MFPGVCAIVVSRPACINRVTVFCGDLIMVQFQGMKTALGEFSGGRFRW